MLRRTGSATAARASCRDTSAGTRVREPAGPARSPHRLRQRAATTRGAAHRAGTTTWSAPAARYSRRRATTVSKSPRTRETPSTSRSERSARSRVGEAHAAEVRRVGRASRPGTAAGRRGRLPRRGGVGLRDDVQQHRQLLAGAEDLPRRRDVVRRDQVRVRARGAVPRQLQHLRPQRREDPVGRGHGRRRSRPGRRSACPADAPRARRPGRRRTARRAGPRRPRRLRRPAPGRPTGSRWPPGPARSRGPPR